MIVTKGVQLVNGYIEYSYEPKDMFFDHLTQDDLDSMFDSDTFDSLEELLNKLKPEVLEEIKKQYDAAKVWISNITFNGKSEDGKTTANIGFSEKKGRGHVSTEINNDDINNRLLLNLEHVKQIIDNTIDQYPVRYR